LRWVPRASTRAARKTPEDAEQQIYELFLRLALWVRDSAVDHPSLLINFDQTQVIMADSTANTFEVEGSKQVEVLGKEEKRAFTAVLAISASGDVLPIQYIFKGSTNRSLPSASAPRMSEASDLGFLYSLNRLNYWSDLRTMQQFIELVVAPYFTRQKELLGYPPDQECTILLDCWSVHRGKPFTGWLRKSYPWLRLRFVPGGTT
ncbi:hypothetical protein CONPUDRAFT_41018, partial [Coniophora puteana RWD-64-598 SS2]